MSSLSWIDSELAALRSAELLRELPEPLARASTLVTRDGRTVVNFASNDYLGLAADSRLADAAVAACQSAGVGRGSSPLICGRSTYHEELERRLAEIEGAEASLVFPSGFAANAGVIPALTDRGDAIYADAKNHASLIDGCRLSRARTHVYPHGNVAALAELLDNSSHFRRRLIVVDTLFSMDGDLAPLPAIAELAERHDAVLLVDEAHATGVFGPRGRGACEHFGVVSPGLVRVGTLSKALGAAGGFVTGSRALITFLANRARSYVFSTAQPAATAAAAIAALDIVSADPSRGSELLATAARLRNELHSRGWNTGNSESQIIPILVGAAADAVAMSRTLLQRGFWLPAIRPPSVPAGESLLRLSLTTAHTPEMLSQLLAALDGLK